MYIYVYNNNYNRWLIYYIYIYILYDMKNYSIKNKHNIYMYNFLKKLQAHIYIFQCSIVHFTINIIYILFYFLNYFDDMKFSHV